MQAATIAAPALGGLLYAFGAFWVYAPTALLYLMTREQRAVRQQGESDMAGSRWYWRTTPLSTGNALLQAVDIEVSLHEDFSPVIQSRRAWFSAVGGQQ